MNRLNKDTTASFWEHLDALKSTLVHILISVFLMGIVAFIFKKPLFSIILAPQNSDFITYRLFEKLLQWLSVSGGAINDFSVKLISVQLTQQFTIHIKMAMYVGFLLVLPYVLYKLFEFVSPALYKNERKYTVRMVCSGYFLFMIGVALSYFLIFPLTFRFLGTYQVDSSVENQITLDSYVGTLMTLNLMMGIVFELPILGWLFAKLGLISAAFLRKYRRHAIVILLTLAAIITPTADAITLFFVALPMYLLYEFTIVIVAHTSSKKIEENAISPE